MTVLFKKAPANYVPAAAVIRRERALSEFIGCKACVGGLISLKKLFYLNAVEASGISSVAVKCLDIRRNTSGEGDLLGRD